MSKLMVFYLLEQGGTELPRAREAITAIVSLSQRHFLKHLGRTFELEDEGVRVLPGPFAPGDTLHNISTAFDFLHPLFTDEYDRLKNAFLVVAQGTQGGTAFGVNRVAVMVGEFWMSTYNTFLQTPHLLSSQDHLPWPHELGHAYGLGHTEGTAEAFRLDAREPIDFGVLPSLTMQRKDVPLNKLYAHPFHVAERALLTDATFHPDKLATWADSVLSPAAALSGRKVSPLPMRLPVVLDEWASGDLTTCFDTGGSRDLYFIKRRQTGSDSVEVHTLSAESGYTAFSAQSGSIIPESDEASGDFLIGGGVSSPGAAPVRPDLFFVKRTNTDTGNNNWAGNRDRRIEVIQVSGESGYRQVTSHHRTFLSQIEDSHGDFLLADFDADSKPDLFFVKRRLTSTNRVEMHILSGSSNYQNFTLQIPTALSVTDDLNGDFLLGNFDGDGVPDLYFIKRRNTESGRIEVHVLSGASQYTEFVEQVATALPVSSDAVGTFTVGDFDGDGRSDLCFIRREGTANGNMEIEVYSAGSRFAQRTLTRTIPLPAAAATA
jgi:hypothetical protein